MDQIYMRFLEPNIRAIFNKDMCKAEYVIISTQSDNHWDIFLKCHRIFKRMQVHKGLQDCNISN
jgi:hypothetical protein